jgi:Glucose / Sorbosone dehydrogenase/PASTA domain
MARAAVAVLVLAAAFAYASAAAPGDPELALVGTFSSPTYVTAPPGDGERLFVVQQDGRIRVVRNGAILPTDFLDLTGPVLLGGERGLLSMAFAPDYAASGRFYVYYTADAPTGELVIAEYRRSTNPDVADPSSGRTVLSISHSSQPNHNGGQLQFGPDGYLYIGTGDGGGGGDPDRNAQNLGSLLGKLLRIDPRPAPAGAPYTVPGDNPFVGRPGARAEVWSYGLRNPWRFSFDRQTGDLNIADVGQGSWEEIDFAPAAAGRGRGLNFGWSCWEGRHAYNPNNGEPACQSPPSNPVAPVWEYPHSRGCSITGGYVVRDPALPLLAGRYVYGDYCTSPVWSIALAVPDGQDDRQTGLSVSSLYSFGEDACGRVYAASGSGPVYRLQPSGVASAPTCTPGAPAPGPPPPPAPPPPASPPPPAAGLVARPGCRVPRVVGRRLPSARTRIRRAHCRVGLVRYKRSTRVRGRVLTQAPRPGARRPRGTRVRLTVSRGRR